ncbi:hypothetical protein V6Z11_D13G105200 [Gossypium hirsutum]
MCYYECEAWQMEGEDGEVVMQVEEDSSLCPVFSIEIFANIVSDHETIIQQLLLPQDQLTQASSTSWSAISSKLSQMEIPFSLHARVMLKIIECARSAMKETQNKKRKNIPIIVTLGPAAATSSEDEAVDKRKGSLKKVKVEEGKFTVVQCVICLEEILDGFKVIQMPCSHIYHLHCILSWLEKSNLCPLCRFQMPT